jgi:hypothetical protein
MATDRKILQKGIRYLTGSLPLLFIGPFIINSSFNNKENPLYPYILGLGIVISLYAIFLLFKGFTTITKSFFDGDKNQNS